MENIKDKVIFVVLMLFANVIGILGVQFIGRYLGRF